MEEKGMVICDSDVLIEFLDRDNQKIKDKLLRAGFQNLCISAITAGELLVGARDKSHFLKLQEFVSDLILIPITNEISKTYLNLIKQYSLSHRLKVQDALIASTALVFDFELYTNNKKDFRFIKGLRLLS
jgi:tRNA(fMet)-specific endonuclease VapC